MTIDDELLLELIKPNNLGEAEGSFLRKIVGAKDIRYSMEESFWLLKGYKFDRKEGGSVSTSKEITICPDIIVTYERGDKQMAIELENDIQWDFGHSLRQIKDYQDKFPDTRIIIPEDYKRFAPLYKNEGFRVYLWKGKRVWQCLRCGTENVKEGPVTPKCTKCGNNSQNDYRLIGLRDLEINEF